MANWTVEITKNAKNELGQLIRERNLTGDDVKVLLRWVDEMEEFGPQKLARSAEWHDHALDKQWAGFRSSAFSSSGRVIYRIIDRKVIVEVHRITANHNYER